MYANSITVPTLIVYADKDETGTCYFRALYTLCSFFLISIITTPDYKNCFYTLYSNSLECLQSALSFFFFFFFAYRTNILCVTFLHFSLTHMSTVSTNLVEKTAATIPSVTLHKVKGTHWNTYTNKDVIETEATFLAKHLLN